VRLLLLLACSLLAGTVGVSRAAPRDTLTVVTLNLWHDQHEWPRRLARILSTLRALRPDVVCLQEVLQHASLPNQARTLADSLGYGWHFCSVDGPERPKRYGNAILTPHRMLRADGRNLLPLDDYRVVAYVRIEVRGREIDVYDTHLHHTPEGGAIRATQVRDLIAFIDSTRGSGPLVLAGDFNAGAGTPELQPLASGYIDTWAATNPHADAEASRTFNPLFGNVPQAIDHIFVARQGRPALMPLSSELLFHSCGADSVWASDHFGVMARIAIGGRPPRQGDDR
jgi:endonuclease/exonuclease/phosphatase family metal-dependent hydrolase